MPSQEASVEVDVDARVAYDQWTQFEAFPAFMAHIKDVRQVDDSHLHWTVDVDGSEKQGDIEITEQIPDQRIAWRSTSGPQNDGAITFEKVRENVTRVTMDLVYDSSGYGANGGAADDEVLRHLQNDLNSFKSFIERRGTETGAWRGEIGTS